MSPVTHASRCDRCGAMNSHKSGRCMDCRKVECKKCGLVKMIQNPASRMFGDCAKVLKKERLCEV